MLTKSFHEAGFISLRSRMHRAMQPASMGDEAICIFVSSCMPIWRLAL